jgi:mannitol/fructose-specific phosphotransferase system IIA component (Ntr-type)
MNLLDILTPEAVKVPLESTEKQPAIFEMIDLLGAAGLVKDLDTLKSVVWEREQQRSTGIGDGLAIPHGKSDCTSDLVMAIGRPPVAIEFGAVDKKPVKLIVLLVSPPAKTADHIQALGKISRLMVNSEFREATYAAEDATTLYELFKQAEG